MKRGIVLILIIVVICSIINCVVAVPSGGREKVYMNEENKLLLKSEWDALTDLAEKEKYKLIGDGAKLKDAKVEDLNSRVSKIDSETLKNYFEKESADALKDITDAKELTKEKEFRDVWKKEEPWKKVVDSDKSKDMFKDIMKQDYKKDVDVSKADLKESSWGTKDGQDILNYRGKIVPVQNPGLGVKMVFGENNWAAESVQPGGTIVNGNLVFDGQPTAGAESPYPKPNPQGGQPIGGGGSPEGGGGIMDKLQGFQQIWGMIAQLLGAIPKGGETTATGDSELAIADGAGVYLPEAEAYAEQNCVSGFGAYGECLDKPAVVRVFGDSSLLASNTELTVGGQAKIYTPQEPITEIELNGIPRDSSVALSASSQLTEEYSSPILAAVISDVSDKQYVRLIQHNLILGGERILVDVLKSFTDVSGSGSELWVKDGGMYLKFDGIKIYYSRRIKDTPYSFINIENELNKKDKFSLIEYVENRGRLIDMNGRISVGDKVVQHPRTEGLGIARVRKDMWVER